MSPLSGRLLIAPLNFLGKGESIVIKIKLNCACNCVYHQNMNICSLQSEIIVVPSGVKKSGSNGSQIMKRSGRKREREREKMSMVKMASVVGVLSKRERERER